MRIAKRAGSPPLMIGNVEPRTSGGALNKDLKYSMMRGCFHAGHSESNGRRLLENFGLRSRSTQVTSRLKVTSLKVE